MSLPLQNINTYTYSPGFQLGQYHNAVLCISGNVQNLYLDGNLIATKTATTNILANYSNINQILIGCAGDKSSGFSGYLDDFRMYNYTLNQTQVSNLYINRNIVVYYPFDNSLNGQTPNYVTLAYDASFVGNAATISTSSQIGNGALQLTNTNTAGSVKSYVTSSSGFSTSATNGISVSLWFKTTGVSGSRMRLFDLCTALGSQGILVDISGTNGIVAGYNGYVAPVVIVTSTTTNVNRIAYYPLTAVNASNYTSNNATGTPVYDFSVPANSIVTTPGSYPSFIGTTSLQISNNKSYLLNIPNATPSYTVGVWFYMTSYVQYNAVLCCGTTDSFGGSGSLMAYSRNGDSSIQLYAPNNGGVFANIPSAITLNTWCFLAWSVNYSSGTSSSLSLLLQYYGATTPVYSGTITVNGLYTAPNYFRLGQQMGVANTAYTSSGSYSNFQYFNTAYTIAQMTNLFNTNTVFMNGFIPTGMKLWLDANVTSSLTKTANAVTQWNDLALNTNVTGTATYSATGCNGKPTIQFNGSSNKLNSTSMSLYTSLTNFYYFAVISIPNNNAIYSPFALTSSKRLAIYLNTAGLGLGLAGSAWTYNDSAFKFNSVATPTNTFIIVCLEVTGSTQMQTFYINGVAGTSVTCSFTSSTPNVIEIGNSGYGNDWFNGNMSEVLVYTPSSSMSSIDRQKIEGYLAWKWGLQTSLPNTHLYYASAPTAILDSLSSTTKTAMLYSGTGTSLSACAFATKLLYTLYSGPVITIRRSSDSVTVDFYADINGTLGTAVGGTGTTLSTWLSSATAYVTKWWDQTGNSNHATQTSPTSQPILKNTTIGSTAPLSYYVDFTGNLFFNLPDKAYPYGNSNYSYIFKTYNMVDTNYAVLLSGGGGSANTLLLQYDTAPSQNQMLWLYSTVSSYSNQNSSEFTRTPNEIDTYTYSNSTRNMYINGTSVTTTTAGNNGSNGSLTPRTQAFTNNILGWVGTARPSTYQLYYFYVLPIDVSSYPSDKTILENS